MLDLYLWLFIAICVAAVLWGMIKPERIYEYPFFMAGTFISFILPQAYVLIQKPDPLRADGVERALIMACLCAAMCLIGYQFEPNSKLLEKLDISIDEKKLYRIATVMVVIGWIMFILLRTTPYQVDPEAGGMTGIGTIWYFFSGIGFVGFTILFQRTVKKPQLGNVLLTVIAAWPLVWRVLAGRRQETATLAIIFGLSFFYVRRLLPPRWLGLVAIGAATFLIPFLAAYRSSGIALFQLFNLTQDDITKLVDEFMAGAVLEFKNAAVIMDSASYSNQYGYGSGYWNFLVFRFIPAQFLGKDFKDSLKIDLVDPKKLTNSFGYKMTTGSTTTGIGDAFLEFSFLGCLFYAFQAFFFKNLWISAVHKKSITSQLFYIGLVAPAMLNITHGTINFFPDLIYQIIFLGTGILYAKAKNDDETTSQKTNDKSTHVLDSQLPK